uniref:Uncharacterized protein n=1 Tax=Arundo donax TaxID=35708 RepID=A0A0A8YV25_ARUDO
MRLALTSLATASTTVVACHEVPEEVAATRRPTGTAHGAAWRTSSGAGGAGGGARR